MTIPVIITSEENWYVATDTTTGIASQGKTIESSLSNLKEALQLYYEDNEKPTDVQYAMLTTLEVI